MIVHIQYEDKDNEYSLPIKFLADELGMTLAEITQAVHRIVEKR